MDPTAIVEGCEIYDWQTVCSPFWLRRTSFTFVASVPRKHDELRRNPCGDFCS